MILFLILCPPGLCFLKRPLPYLTSVFFPILILPITFVRLIFMISRKLLMPTMSPALALMPLFGEKLWIVRWLVLVLDMLSNQLISLLVVAPLVFGGYTLTNIILTDLLSRERKRLVSLLRVSASVRRILARRMLLSPR